MIEALLVIIVLILLLGAGVVSGWLLNIAGGCLFIIIIVLAVLWLGSHFGENGPENMMWGIGGVLFLLSIAGVILQEPKKKD